MYLGLFERAFERKPLTTARACIALFPMMMLIFGISAYYQNELDRFLVDYPSISIVIASLLLIYAERRQGVQIRYSVDLICSVYDIDDNIRNEFLRAVFSFKTRIVAGAIGSIVVVLLYEGLGFWYESPLLLHLGRVFAALVGFVVGELAIAALNFILMSKAMISAMANQVETVDHGKLTGLQSLGSVSLQNAIAGSTAGFIALFGIIAAPWRTGLPATEIAVAILCTLFLLVAGELAIPINHIHRVMRDAKVRSKVQISAMLLDASERANNALTNGFTDENQFNTISLLFQHISILEAQNQKYPEWPFDISQVIGVIGSLGMVAFETALVLLLSAGI